MIVFKFPFSSGFYGDDCVTLIRKVGLFLWYYISLLFSRLKPEKILTPSMNIQTHYNMTSPCIFRQFFTYRHIGSLLYRRGALLKKGSTLNQRGGINCWHQVALMTDTCWQQRDGRRDASGAVEGGGGGVAGGGSLDGVKQPSSGSSGRMSLPNERRGTNCWVSFFAGSFFVDCWRTLRRFSFIFPLEFVNLRIG